MIFDTHAHLNSSELYPIIDEVISRAKNDGVTHFLVPGFDSITNKLSYEISKKYSFCYGAVGFHPSEIDSVNDLSSLYEYAKNSKIKAIGEIGLDYYYEKDENKKEKQRELFIKQIEIANDLNLPVIIHSRDASFDTLNILKAHTPKKGGIMHCYGGSVENVFDFIKLGFYISLGGPLTFKNARIPKEVCKIVPLDHLLTETDSPYLSPTPFRGKINEPKNIIYVIKEMALLRNCSEEEISALTFKNALKILNIKNEY